MGSSGQLALLTSSDNSEITLLLLHCSSLVAARLLTLHTYYTAYLSSCHQAEISLGMSHALDLFMPY